ncbi:MAG: CHASE2 domain-containing protein, partial [Acidobacteria bacterium]|nr:CHASE2 domain-containing protein [Acidobacteriota bacterium]
MRRLRSQAVPIILILLFSLSAVIAVTWLAPSLTAATANMLFRLRGETSPPADIVIVAIDDASLQQVGNWPWPRSVMASVLDRLTEAKPRAVGLDVIYAESSEAADDRLLSEAVKRNAHVVLPAQLIEAEASPSSGLSTWLSPLPEIKDAAAAIGHAHADPDVDGVLRTVQLSKADAKGERLWAFGLETLRVAEAIPPAAIEEKRDALRLGQYEIAIHDEAEKSSLEGVSVIRPNEMFINYLGPPQTFPYYSIADVLNGKVAPQTFTNKIVLIGAVAQTMGDTRITPFISYGGSNASGTGMPGVEVHANVIETIRRRAWLRPLADWLNFSIALLVILTACVIIRLLDGWRALLSLFTLLALILLGSLYVF